MTALLVVFPRGQLSAKDKERMTKAGIVAVEADDPNSVCQLQLTAPMVNTKLNGDALVLAALAALGTTETTSATSIATAADVARSKFVSMLAAALAPQGEAK